MTELEFLNYIAERYYLDGETIRNKTTNVPLNGSPKAGGYIRVDIYLPGRKKKTIGLHRLKFFLAHKFIAPVIDHLDRCCSRNDLSNLRAASMSQNTANSKKKSGTSMPYKGVYRLDQKRGVRYRARFLNKTVGTFDTPEEAALAYDEASRAVYGSFGRYNFPLNGELPCRIED